MGDGIDPVVLNGIISSLFALLLLWLKSTMHRRMSEFREKLSVSNTNLIYNLSNLSINLIQIATKIQVNKHCERRGCLSP